MIASGNLFDTPSDSTPILRFHLPQRYMSFVTVEPPPNFRENHWKPDSASLESAVFYRKMLSIGLFLAASVSLASARDLALVSNKANSVSGITVPDLVKVSKGQTNRWPDGKSVTLIMRSPSIPQMKVFLEKIYELPESQVKEIIASANHGRMGHPAVMIVDSDEDLVNKVASIPGAIGIVDVYAINSSVAVVKVAGKLPLEPGYLLHGN